MKKFWKNFDEVIGFLVAISFASMCMVIFFQVLSRYVLSYSLPWSEEVGRFLFLAVSYLGIALGMKRKAHLRVDILLIYLPSAAKSFFEILSQLASAFFFLFIVYTGFGMTMKVWQFGQNAISIPLPIWIVWAVIPSCALVTALYCFKNIFEILFPASRQPSEEKDA